MVKETNTFNSRWVKKVLKVTVQLHQSSEPLQRRKGQIMTISKKSGCNLVNCDLKGHIVITFSQHWLTWNLSRFLYHMKDRIFLINILKFDDPIQCNYGEINDKMSKMHYFLFTTELLADLAISLYVSLVTFKINIFWN